MTDMQPGRASSPADTDAAAAINRRYLIRFEADMVRSRPLWIRVIVEFAGTFLLVMVAAGAGVISYYAGGHPISRGAAVIAPGALVMALIYAWGPLSGLHINPVVTLAFTVRRVFPADWVVPYWIAQFAGASWPRCSCRPCSATSARAATTPSPGTAGTGGRSSWRSR